MKTRLLFCTAVAALLPASSLAVSAPKYVAVRLPGLNQGDSFAGANALSGQWTWNPFSFRYGYWGGFGWTDSRDLSTNDWNGQVTAPTVNAMDGHFRAHDQTYQWAHATFWWNSNLENAAKTGADLAHLAGLTSLGSSWDPTWGPIYNASSPSGAPQYVAVAWWTNPLLRYGPGMNYYPGTKNMPFSEYARREAQTAFLAQIGYRLVRLRY
jgi:hypothetical protein